jgi:hypothetical protein
MYLIHPAQLPFFFNTGPWHIDGFFLTWNQLRSPFVAEFEVLPSQPFMNSLCHFLVILERCQDGTDAWLCSGVMQEDNDN